MNLILKQYIDECKQAGVSSIYIHAVQRCVNIDEISEYVFFKYLADDYFTDIKNRFFRSLTTGE